ncbi:hypothetical protein [Nocardia farcinica]|uniref:hypothetical protein n=1 Tax=Nocardia farcinica TaxID=37329 RepID=UPI0018951B8D|nr:hypothetical protein [Nocardia farcinica]MBF6189503.1 hypothetical protein [Nocardia farcinica]
MRIEEFIRARLDEDKAIAKAAAALRAALEHVERMVSPSQQIEAEEDVLYPIAAIWSDHPDYQPEWAV